MTNEEIQKAKESFLRMGVAEGSIFSEIMRARYLDYNLFLNPTNAEYGVTIESLYENMKLTSDKFGDYTGNLCECIYACYENQPDGFCHRCY